MTRRRIMDSDSFDVGNVVFVSLNNKIISVKPQMLSKFVLNDNYQPIGVIVYKNNGSILICSLVLMSCDVPSVGSTDIGRNDTKMHWGPSMTIGDIPNCKSLEDAIADINGSDHTKVLVNKRGNKDYSKWTPGNLIYFDYPAPSCCDIFYTYGTNQQGWYLPAFGELWNLFINYEIVNNSLVLLQELGIDSIPLNDHRYWSSSDYGGLYAWNLIPNTGSADYNNKQTNNYLVRAFYQITI